MNATKSQETLDGKEYIKAKEPVALILAGYNKVDPETKKKAIQELNEAYDGDIIYMGQNKFLHDLAGKPVIQYVIDAVYNARKKGSSGQKLYNRIYIYNDIKTIRKSVDLAKYSNITVHQMKDSVGAHLQHFYENFIEYGQRVDIFYGDTPRITSEDVEWIHDEYSGILGIEKNRKGNQILMVYGIVESGDLNDNWLTHRLKFIKVGKNKGKLKSFAGFDSFQARVGNSAAFIKNSILDDLVRCRAINFFYNLRKALSPTIISRIIYHLWKTKNFKMIWQIKNRCINEAEFINTAVDVWAKVFKIDLSKFGGKFYHIKRNASRWENDIDSPKDLKVLNRKFKPLNIETAEKIKK
ncbi:MAG: hypothetical protein JW864_16255 [Spirochaetes bacterium]|nr:hypothetical protein [Spirochaetota bacterium]